MRKTIAMGLLMILIMLCVPVSIAYALRIDNLGITTYQETSTSIEWQTDSAANASIYYWENNTQNYTMSDAQVSRNHHIELPTQNGHNYSYIAASCDAAGACVTAQKDDFSAGPDTIAPYVNLSAPNYTTTNSVDVYIQSEQKARSQSMSTANLELVQGGQNSGVV